MFFKEVQSLSNRMKTISNLSESLSEMFDKNRATVRQLTEKSRTIERLQYFVKLPEILKVIYYFFFFYLK